MRRILAISMVAVVVAACDVGTSEPAPLYFEWQGQVVFDPEWDHVQGVAAFGWNEGDEEITALVRVEQDEPGEVRQWELRHGSCAAPGEIVGSESDYPQVEVGGTGAGEVLTTVPEGVEDVDAAYHVLVHMMEADVRTTIGCGDLVLVIIF